MHESDLVQEIHLIGYLVIRFPEKIWGNFNCVCCIRDDADADADAVVSSLVISYTPNMTYCSDGFIDIYV